ncbi:MAG: hypothetical protein AB7U18_25150 [Dehalococcoidia bacterium]
MEEQAEHIDGDPETMRGIVEKLQVWSDCLSPSEQVMLGLLLKRLDEVQPIEPIGDDCIDPAASE